MKAVIGALVTSAAVFFASIAFAESSKATATFVIQHKGVQGTKGKFVVRTDDPVVIEKARNQLKKPKSKRTLFVNGALVLGDGNINSPWHWHIKDGQWDLVQKSIELCDGTPEMVEQDLINWIDNVKRFCPWKSFVLEEKM